MRWAQLAAGMAIVFAAGVAQAKPAPAPPPPADVDVAEQLYTKLDYEKANDVATRVLQKKGLTHDQLVRATKILAITNAVLDKEEDSREAFLALLVYEPDFTVDSALGPKVSGPFMEARGHFRSLPSKPGIEVVPNVREGGGQLRVTTRDPTKIAKKVAVGWRWTSSGEYTVTSIAVGEGAVEVAAAPTGRTRLDYYAQALDERDNAVFEAGSATVPKSAFAEAGSRSSAGGTKTSPTGPQGEDKKGGSVFGSPLFWIITAVVVAGGATATYFIVNNATTPTSASLSPQIRCGVDLCR